MRRRNNESRKGPGKAYRRGVSLIELAQMFPDDATAEKWFTEGRWPGGIIRCPRCNGGQVAPRGHKTMPHHCRECRRFFSVKTGTVMEGSNIGYQKWAFAIYLMATNLKGTSSMHLHRDLGITQKSAWFMAHRIRMGWEQGRSLDDGPVEVDEAYFGGKEGNKHANKRQNRGRGTVGKTVVAAARDRASGQISAEVVPATTKRVLHEFIEDHADENATLFTDDLNPYHGLANHHAVRHSVGEYVNQQAQAGGRVGVRRLQGRGLSVGAGSAQADAQDLAVRGAERVGEREAPAGSRLRLSVTGDLGQAPSRGLAGCLDTMPA